MIFSDCHLTFSHHTIFENFQFDLAWGEWTCILGKSGVGKSSLLKILAGLIQPHTIKNYTPLEISYLPQRDCLLPWLSVLDNVLLGYKLRSKSPLRPPLQREEMEEKAQYLLTQVGLSHALHLKPSALSGGMRQRVALVRTLMEDKPVILMDEPFSALDVGTRLELHDLMIPLLQDKTILLVTHDPLDAIRLADNIQSLSGSPATLSTPLKITESKPRNLENPEIIKIYMQLIKELVP